MSEHDPSDLAVQARKSERARKRAELADTTEADDLRWLMKSPRGRRIVWRQLDRAGVFRLSFDTTAMVMAFNEGRRNEGLRLMSLVLAHCPQHYSAMLEEQRQQDTEDAAGTNTN